MDNISFSSLGLSPEILKAVEALGFEQAAPIQAAAIPVLMSGKDVVGQSQTGSGKTAAFAIPAIELCDEKDRSVQVLIMCPTRELATQVAEEVHKLTAFKRGIHAVPIYGGASYERQFFELKKGVQIVIGTPGRLIDHLERGTLMLDNVKMVILDEADRMLDMGFRDDIRKILDTTPKERQTVFFSATVSAPIREMINRYAKDPQMVKIEQKEVTAPAIEQWFYEIPWRMKLETLIRLVDYHGFKLGIIFCNTQRMVDELADTLIAQGFSADRLHGGIAQAQRTRVMNKFKKAEFQFLVATDVAARGIDVDDLELVVNYDLPYDAEDYVHRIGRTGRAGKRGMAITFVSGRDIYKLQFIERFTKTKIRKGSIPTSNEVEEKKTDVLLDRVRVAATTEEFRKLTPLVDRLLEEGLSSTDIAAALFHILVGGAPEPAPTAARPAIKEAAPFREERAPREYKDRSPERAPREFKERAPREFQERAPDRAPREFKERAPREFKERPTESAPREFKERAPKFEEKRPAKYEKELVVKRRDDRPAGAAPVLRKPAPGMQWVSLNVGKGNDAGPRDIIDLIATRTGLPGRNVGAIELSDKQSFAQVPDAYVQQIARVQGNAVWQDAPVEVSAWHHGATGAKREFTPPKRTGGGKKFEQS